MTKETKNLRLSVVIPAYNEASRLPVTLGSVEQYLKGVSYTTEVLLVLNNCSDDTARVAKSWQDKISNLFIFDIKTPSHVGNAKGYAIRYGLARARGDYHAFMDADNATDISEINKFWSVFDLGSSVVIGSRYVNGAKIVVKQKLMRRFLSRVGNILIQILVLPGIQDTQCGFKVFTKDASQTIVANGRVYGWGADIEMLVIAKKFNYRITEVPIVWCDKAHSMLRANAFWQTLKELIRIWWRN